MFTLSNQKLTFEELRTHLWNAADILDEKGGIDANEYRKPILGMLFLKRLSDVFEDRAISLEKKYGKDEAWNDPDRHPFFIPKESRWNKIEDAYENIGEILDQACIEIEKANSKLKGVLTNITYNNKTDYSDEVLLALISHFSKKDRRLGKNDLENEDVFGQAYEYLIGQFADSAGQKAGEFFTPREVVQLLVELLEPKEGMKICDPTCGSGGMLIWSRKYVEQHHENPKNVSLHGQEKSSGNYGMCVMNMIVHGIENFRIENENLHTTPLLVENGKLLQYDRVIANYPFSRDWDSSKGEKDPYGRYSFGIPQSKGKADYAFIQEMYSHLNDKGKATIVCSQGVLFRGSKEGKIRTNFIKNDLIEAVIALPTNLFYGTSIPACILILNKNKPDKRKGKIIFVYAAKDFEDGKQRDLLRESDIKKIVSAIKNYKNIEKYCHVANMDELEENDFNLNIPRYVDISELEEPIDLQEAFNELKKSYDDQNTLKKLIEKDLKGLNIKI
jgi:type I restriction enzyme M protein